MSLIASAAASEPIPNWAALRSELVEAIAAQCARLPPCQDTVDPLTKVTEKCEEMRLEINKSLYSFEHPPFTIQRIAELAREDQGYTTLPKYLRALRHCLAVTSTIADFDDEALLKLIEKRAARDVLLEPIEWAD